MSTIVEVGERERGRLVGLAYRMLGSMSEAEDVVQDAIVKASINAPDDLDEPLAYLTTVTTRTAIDVLRSARVRREQYVGPWLPEPVLADPMPDGAAAAELADSLSLAFLVLLESLTPDERAALLLHDVFAYPHAEVATLLGRSEAASRQLLRRARQQVEARRPRFEVDDAEHGELVRRFAAACAAGELDGFLALLTDSSTYVGDGGATTKAARRPILGADRIGRFLSVVLRRYPGPRFEVVRLNGEPAMAVFLGRRLDAVVALEPAADGRIDTIRWIRNPDKLAHVRATLEGGPAAPR